MALTMIELTAPLWIWQGEASGRWHFITIPDEQAGEFRAEAFGNRRGFGSVRVRCSIEPSGSDGETAVEWLTSVFPTKGGGYLLPVKAAVRNKAGLAEGDQVKLAIELI